MRDPARFALAPRGPFALAAARAFLASFGPAGQALGDDPAALLLAFAVDGTDAVAAVRLTEDAGVVHGELLGGGEHARAAERQVARILSLDHDGAPFAALAAADPLLAAARARAPGLRPVLFSSPYEAAAWSVLSARVQVAQAVRLRARLVEAAGSAVVAGATTLLAFPPPRRLLACPLEELLPPVRAARLRAVAQAAADGRLDAAALLRRDPQDALAALQELPGLGPFYAALVLIRGAGAPDVLPAAEPRVRAAAARAAGDPALAEPEAFAARARAWRPWRAWAAFLLRATA